MLSSKISAADEEDVLEELAALQAEQVQVSRRSVAWPLRRSDAHTHESARTQVKMPHAPLHALPERQQTANEAGSEPEREEEVEFEPERERRQAVLA